MARPYESRKPDINKIISRRVSHKNRGREAARRARELESALEGVVKEERVVLVDFAQAGAFVVADISVLYERPQPDQNVHGGQGIIAAVDKPFVQVFAGENGLQRASGAVELRHCRDLAEHQS